MATRAPKIGPKRKPRGFERRISRIKRGYCTTWERVRLCFLAENPCCHDCDKQGYVTEAVEVHHIQKIRDRPELRFEFSNLMALCKSCHSKRTARGE